MRPSNPPNEDMTENILNAVLSHFFQKADYLTRHELDIRFENNIAEIEQLLFKKVLEEKQIGETTRIFFSLPAYTNSKYWEIDVANIEKLWPILKERYKQSKDKRWLRDQILGDITGIDSTAGTRALIILEIVWAINVTPGIYDSIQIKREVLKYPSFQAKMDADTKNRTYWATPFAPDANVIEPIRLLKALQHHVVSLAELHPRIKEKCETLYRDNHFAEAVEKSFKTVRDRLRELTGHETGSEAFGKGKLHIRGAVAPNVDFDFNEGVKFLTMAIDRFRNEKSHTSDSQIQNPIRAFEYLCLSSLAMNLLEDAQIRENNIGE
jgi:uncharacterized protein (TIGR02391 family)